MAHTHTCTPFTHTHVARYNREPEKAIKYGWIKNKIYIIDMYKYYINIL